MEKLYSLEELEAISDNDKAFITTMKQIFEEEMLLSLEKLNKAFAENDHATIKTIAHTMKPSIDNLHILSIKSEIRSLEHQAANNADIAVLQPLAQKVETVLREVIADMKKAE